MLCSPRQVPPLDLLLSDLDNPCADAIAADLGVSVRSVYSWKRAGEAPRPAALALFWQTCWGRSQVEAQAVNDARSAHGLAQALARENATLRARVAYLERVGQFGSANAPLIDSVSVSRTGPGGCAWASR